MYWIKHLNGGAWDIIAQCRDKDLPWLKSWFLEWCKTHPGSVCFINHSPDEVPKWLSNSAYARTVEEGIKREPRFQVPASESEHFLPGFAPPARPNYSRGLKKKGR